MVSFFHHKNSESDTLYMFRQKRKKLIQIFNAYGKIELTIFFVLAIIIAGLVVEHNVLR
jgi:hypothetical protein